MPVLEALRGFLQPHVDAEAAEGREHELSHVRVERRHHLVALLEQRDVRAATHERLRHLETDVPAADHDDLVHAAAGHLREKPLCVPQRLHTVHVRAVDAREVGAYRAAPGRDQELVEAHAQGAVLVEGADLDGSIVKVDRRHLVSGTDVDPQPIAELLRGARNELVDALDLTADEVGDAARGVRGVPTPLERDDLHVVALLADLRERSHAARIPADDHEPFRHPPQDRGAIMERWLCAPIAATTRRDPWPRGISSRSAASR